MVSRALRFDSGPGRYVGGVSYQLVDARPEVVLAALADVSNWPDALPRTKAATLVGSADGLSRVQLVQGTDLVDARYTVVLEQGADGETIRFWLDPTRPHDIRDVWGYFRVQAMPGGRSLITVGAALDLGDGITRLLFEDKIARMMLHAARKIRDFVEPRALAFAK
jgi:Polyketide cyclase / dehydrase and lipid transport